MWEVLKDLWAYMRERKKIWLTPLIIILVLMGIILIFGIATGLTPFIYPIF